MNILVCFKAVEELDSMLQEDWKADSSLHVDVSFVKSVLNCFDESALEMALKLSDLSESFDLFTHLTALTIGDMRSDPFLKTLYALRYDKAVRIDNNNEDIRFTPEKIAEIIADYASANEQDIIIMGNKSGVGDNGKTPLLTAEILGWPCITHVIHVEWEAEYLKVISHEDDGVLTQVIEMPIVLTIGNAPNSYMRVPTLKDKMKYGKKDIEIINMDKCVRSNEADQLISLIATEHNRGGVRIEGADAREKAQILYDSYLKERLGQLSEV